jgi:tripartite-type tricarboxylate transporter receptor subunit TctC
VNRLLVVLALGASTVIAVPAAAQQFPSRAVRVVVPFPPGGVDVVARVVTTKMGELTGQPFVLENRAGANGIIGSEFVMRAPADGYTLLVTTSSTLVTSLFLSKNVPFDPVKDFTPIGAMYEAVQMLAVRSGLPVNSVKELIDYARRNPGKLSYASSGLGSAFHFMGEALKQMAGVDILHVPYKGTGPVAVALMSGEVDMAFPTFGNLAGNLGKVRVLAVTDAARYPRYPDVPTVAETLPGFRRIRGWIALFGPAGTPQPVVARLNTEMRNAMRSPEARATLERNDTIDISGPPSELAGFIRTDMELSAALAKAIGIKPE